MGEFPNIPGFTCDGVLGRGGMAVVYSAIDLALGRRVAIDPGSNTLRATATGRAPWQTTVRALEGGTVEVTLPALAKANAVEPEPKDEPRPAPTRSVWRSPSGRAQRIGAIVVGAVLYVLGLLGMGKGAHPMLTPGKS